MPLDGAMVATPPAGTTAVPNTVVASAPYNALKDDIYNIFNTKVQPVSGGGTGRTTPTLPDSVWEFINSVDNTKRLGFDLSAITAATKRTLSVQDRDGTIALNIDVSGYATTATASGTTTLTAASAYQQYFTGTANQTVVLPVVSTLTLGKPFRVVNNSTGALTVQSSGANTIVVVPSGRSVLFTCILTSGTTAASWDYQFVTSELSFSASPSGAASVTFSGLPTSIKAWRLEVINLKPVADSDNLSVRMSSSGTPVATNYQSGILRTDYNSAAPVVASSTTYMVIGSTVGNDVNEGISATATISNLGQAGFTYISGTGTIITPAGGVRMATFSGALLSGAAYSEINVSFAGGNIASGELRLYAIGA